MNQVFITQLQLVKKCSSYIPDDNVAYLVSLLVRCRTGFKMLQTRKHKLITQTYFLIFQLLIPDELLSVLEPGLFPDTENSGEKKTYLRTYLYLLCIGFV